MDCIRNNLQERVMQFAPIGESRRQSKMYIGYSRPGSPEEFAEMLSKMDSEGYHGLQPKAKQYAP